MMRTSHRRCFRAGVAFCFLILLLAPGTVDAATLRTGDSPHQQSGSSSTPQTVAKPYRQEADLLEPGKRIERSLTGIDTHRYQLNLQKGQCAVIRVEQRGINVAVQLLGSDNDPVIEVDDEIGKQGTETLDLVADSGGTYTLAVKPQVKVASGAYEISLVEVREATPVDRALYESRRLRTKALHLYAANKRQEALPPAQQALTLAQQALGNEHEYVALVTRDVAEFMRWHWKFAEAKSGFEQALQMLTAKLGAEHPQTILTKSRLGGFLCLDLEDYSKADELLSQALESAERVLGGDDPLVARTLSSLGSLHLRLPDYTKAEREFQRALEILEGAGFTDDDPEYLSLLTSMGVTYIYQKKFDKAGTYHERVLALREKKFGPDSPELVITLNNLGVVACGKKDFTAAERYYLRVLAIKDKYLGPESPNLVINLGNLGIVYSFEGEYKKALDTYLHALRLLEKASFPPSIHREALENAARAYVALGDFENAYRIQSQVELALESEIALNLAIGSERQKLAYLDSVADDMDDTISLNLQFQPNNSEAAALAATALLRRKGRVLDAMSDTLGTLRNHSDSSEQGLLDGLKQATTQLARVALQGQQKQSLGDYRKELHELQETKEKLENVISHHNEAFRVQLQAVTLEAVQSAIPSDSALAEFVTYRPFNPKAQSDDEQYGNLRYGAYVLHRDAAPKGIDLGEAKAIDALVEKLRAALREPNRGDVGQLAQAVAEKVFQPLRPLVAGDKRLLVSPDGQLSLIPFEALRDSQGRYLIERFSISYLPTGRDLLRMKVPRPVRSAPVVVANPLFGESGTLVASGATPQPRSAHARTARRSVTTGADFSSLYFAPLEGTKAEARSIQALFPEAQVLTGKEASQGAIERLNAPRILHIATHGFFLQDASRQANAKAGDGANDDPENPLLRSGLALSGANLVKDGRSDGILTALQASNLNLWGTKLVTLSACDTGVGEVKTGEGVYGLRRSFFLAGAETLVMSLWPVSDYVTREMMTEYYTGLKKGLGRGEALRQAELAMLRHKGRQHPFYWASFIQSGEWANLDGQR
jgi:CHAT domain-containing protein/Tfp pilus assembly protein PilF